MTHDLAHTGGKPMTDHEITYHVQGLTTIKCGLSAGKLSYWEEHMLVDQLRLNDNWKEPESAAEAFALKRALEKGSLEYCPGYYEDLRVVRITRLEEVLTFDEVNR